MDNLSVYSALNILRISFREAPSWDDDLQALYRARLAETPAPPRLFPRLAVGLAGFLEAAAARLRRTVDEPAARPWHA